MHEKVYDQKLSLKQTKQFPYILIIIIVILLISLKNVDNWV